MIAACYRSDHPAVVSVWEDTQRRYRAAHEAIGTFQEKYDGTALVSRGGSNYRLMALMRATVPAGGETAWRYVRKLGGWVPRRNTKAGKALAAEFDACQARNLGNVPGLPLYVQSAPGASSAFDLQGARMRLLPVDRLRVAVPRRGCAVPGARRP